MSAEGLDQPAPAPTEPAPGETPQPSGRTDSSNGAHDATAADNATGSYDAIGSQTATGSENAVATAARRDVGAALRRLGHAVVGHHVEHEVLESLAESLERFADIAERGGTRRRPADSFVSHLRQDDADAGTPIPSYDDRPFSGRASPWGLDLTVHRRGDEAVADITLASAHEGAPGRAHGGIVAGLFDDVFGFVLGLLAVSAFTGELTVHYRRPTPLHTALVCRGRLARREGRKLWITGELADGDDVVASATGLFITVDPGVFRGGSQQLPAPGPTVSDLRWAAEGP